MASIMDQEYGKERRGNAGMKVKRNVGQVRYICSNLPAGYNGYKEWPLKMAAAYSKSLMGDK